MKAVIVIPARWASKRFPGKPLCQIAGKSLLHRTWSIAKAVKNVDEVYVATDDERIVEHVTGFGGTAVITRTDCENGTERAFDAVSRLPYKPELVINLQGDAVLTPPWIIEELVEAMKKDPSVGLATPAIRLDQQQIENVKRLKQNGHGGGTMVTFDLNFNALFFSRALIPLARDGNYAEVPLYRHIGIYGYTFEVLKEYLTLSPTPLESVEKLEQLRALEHGIGIKVVPVDYRGRTHWAVDSPDDVLAVESIIAREGELV